MSSSAKPNKQTTDRINVLNIGLMIASAVLAYIWPFYLFLIAYAVLGPLHYLTEISWLHDRSYFTNHRKDYLLLFLAAAIYGSNVIVHYPLPQIVPNVVLLAFIASLIMVVTKSLYPRIALATLGVAAVLLFPISYETVVTGMLLLTVIHVFVFTGLFIVHGAMRSASRTGYASALVFLGLATLLFTFTPMPGGGVTDGFVRVHYDKAFGDLNVWILRAFHLSSAGAAASDPFEFSPGALAVMRFLAFAYLYHYLNWFSKTRIIRWHEVSKPRLMAVALLWLGAVAVYAIDYDLGINVLFFLSALHVLLEFPLDFRTIIGISGEVRKRVRTSDRELSAA